MPRAHHRLNFYVVPQDVDRVPPDPRDSSVWRTMVEEGMLLDSGWSGPMGDLLVPGGFSRVRIDQPRGRTVFANRLGGFSVRCRDCGAGLGRELSESVTLWRDGGDSGLRCSGCQAWWGFHELNAEPGIAVGRFALEWRDVGGLEFSSLGQNRVREMLGGEYRMVLSRG